MVSIRKLAAVTKVGLGLSGIALVAGIIGCGGSTTNNDQGTSFSALGFFTAATPEPPPGLSGFNTTLASDSAASGFAQESLAYIGLENRLRTSFLRVTKIDCDYYIPGATISIPSDSIAVSGFINASSGIGGPQIGGAGGSGGVGGAGGGGTAAGGATGGATGGTATGGAVGGAAGGPATGTGSRQYIQFGVVSPAIYGFLNANRNSLPEFPFQMQMFCSATAISNAGTVFESNQVALSAVFVEQSFIDTDGSSGGTGTGGDLTGFDGTDTTGGDTTTVGGGTTTGTATTDKVATDGEIISVD